MQKQDITEVMDKSKKKGITWGEAAKMVLEHSVKPLNHKEILQAILDRNLKEVHLKFSQALACLNAMLHANSRTASSLFIKIGGRNCCYRLNENRTDLLDCSGSDSDSPGSSSNDAAETKETGQDNMEYHPGILSSDMSGSLPPISSILGSYQSHATSSSVSSTIACAIADSRLSSLIAPTPDTAAPSRSSLAKKRSVKPCFGASKKPRVTFKLDNEKKVKNDRPTRVKTKAELKYMEDDSAVSQNFIPPVLRPPMYPTHTVTVKNSSSGYFGQKRHKKMSIAAQVKRSKEGQVDLVSPDSILSKINVRTLINFETFNLLPRHYQYQLVKLLPEVDQDVGSKGEIRPTSTAFSNEFFTSAFESWKERLSEGEFTPEMSQKIQQEQEKIFNQDPWKTKHFESVWGEKLLESERYTSPVERSHLIMEQVHIEWEKEQERLAKEKAENEKLRKEQEKLKETENKDLSAPNKITLSEQEPVKNLTSKQKAALVRQQKLAKAKSVSNKAHKKTSKSGKNSSKNAKEAGAVKVTDKNKNKQGPKNGAKQAKVKSPTNVAGSDVQTFGSDVVVDVVGSTGQIHGDSGMTLAETGAGEVKPSSSEGKTTLPQEPISVLPGIVVSEQPAMKEKPSKKSTKKKKEPKGIAANSTLGFPCMCVLKPMVMCRRCGAFCHSDCISPMSICAACVA